ncbi:MAG: aminotransferase class III-fold pyridoxal phosphate-dependent enzyme, partial [Bacteroidaceae bacterium]|nr:aminotransferase class III-fold pyridoxal phosphate-dependent enzyme [Bacteroidaceae bacterium]
MNIFDVYPLYPIERQEYLDLYGGHAVISIGHAHPHYVDAIAKQVASLG